MSDVDDHGPGGGTFEGCLEVLGEPPAPPEEPEGLAQLASGPAAIGEDMPQPGIEGADGLQHAHITVTVLEAGDMHHQADQVVRGVGDDVALASFDLLACIPAARASAFRGSGRLAVDHARGGLGSRPAFSRAAMTTAWLMTRQRPLGIREVACVAQARPPILRASDVSAGHGGSVVARNPKEL